MCGIAGIFQAKLSQEELNESLRRMSASLVHRGPDEAGSVLLAEIPAGLAARRLSIVDIEHGSQPVHNEVGTVVAVFNGEIYNHDSLREQLAGKGHRFRSRCDSEVIVHLYEEYGGDCLTRLHGMFGLAVVDVPRRRLLLARDGPGMKPVYFAETSHGFLFASELKALLASGLVAAQPDPRAIDTFLAAGFFRAPQSGFRGIEKLPAGHSIVVSPDGIERRTFWRLSYDNSHPAAPEEDYARELEHLLGAAVKSHLAADVPVGAFVSGGWDSSLVAAYAAEASGRPLKTFSIVFPEDRRTDESRYSRLLAHHLGTDHHEIEFRTSQLPELLPAVTRHLEEPCSAAPAILIYQLSSLAVRHVKTVISGEGADELFGGYSWVGVNGHYRLRPFLPRAPLRLLSDLLDHPRRRRVCRVLGARDDLAADAEWFRGFSPLEKRRLLRPDLRAGGPDLEPLRMEPETLASCADRLQRRLGLDFTGRLSDCILSEADKMSMAHSLETRMPFLDRSVIDFALRLPSAMKVRNGRGKYILSLLARRLPGEIAGRTKQGLGFPAGRLTREPLRSFVREFLLDPRSGDAPLNRAYVEARLGQWLNPSYREYRRVMMLIFLQGWWNEFFQTS